MAVLTTSKQIAGTVKRSKANLRETVTATEVTYAPSLDVLVLKISNGTRCIVPREQLQGLQEASRKEISHFELVGGGSGIHWPDLDADLSVEGLVSGVYGTKRWMAALGRRGGSVRSNSKAVAARRNGLKGGRPRAVRH